MYPPGLRSKMPFVRRWNSSASGSAARSIHTLILWLQRLVTANSYPLEPDILVSDEVYRKNLMPEDCHGALKAMPNGGVLVEYYDYEPADLGQPSISLPIQCPIGRGSQYKCPVAVGGFENLLVWSANVALILRRYLGMSCNNRQRTKRDWGTRTSSRIGASLNMVRQMVEKLLVVCVIRKGGIGAIWTRKNHRALVRARIRL